MGNRNKLHLEPFDASDYLDNEETIAEYLKAALENPDPDAFLVAVSDVAKARGMATVAANAGLGPGESLQGAQARCATAVRYGAPVAECTGCQARRYGSSRGE